MHRGPALAMCTCIKQFAVSRNEFNNQALLCDTGLSGDIRQFSIEKKTLLGR